MSLFDDASLAMIPSAYKDGKLYSIKPTDGSGDFTFTRGSNLAATRVDVNGLIEKGRENLLLQSNQFDTTWFDSSTTATGGQSGYDGSSDAWELNKTGTSFNYVAQNITLSGVKTCSVYAKAGTLGGIRLLHIGGGNSDAYFNLNNGTIFSQDAQTIDASIESVGNGWYRCSFTNNESITQLRIYPITETGDFNTSGTIYIQDAQLEQGLVATDYIETTTTTAQAGILEDMPRLDYSGGASCPSLLLEPQRTNNVLFSEYRQGSDAADFRITTTSNAAISPEGLQNATLFTENTDTDTHFHSIGSVSWVSGTTYTISAYVKSNGRDLHLGVGNPAVIQFTTTYDLTNGVVLSSSASASSIEDAGNGWWRITATATAALSSGTNILPFLYNNATNYAGDGTSGIYVYGFQAESNASYPSSYIPTYGTSQTRSQDFNTSSFADIETEGTMFGEIEVVDTGSFGTPMALSVDDFTSNFILVYKTNINVLSARVRFGGVDQILIYSGTLTEGYHKFAFRYRENNCEFFVDGVSVGTDTSVSIPTNLNVIRQYIGGSTNPFVGGTKQLLYFPTALTDSECIALTTL